MELTLAKVTPLLSRPPSAAQTPRVESWLEALKVLLEQRYGSKLTTEVEPVFLTAAVDALQRRLDKVKQMVDSEGAGSFSVKWNPASSLGGWFLPAEIADLDSLVGVSGTRTYRTPAPDHIRFNNRIDTYEPGDELEEIANETIRGSYVPPA